jgi:hypothetical protein
MGLWLKCPGCQAQNPLSLKVCPNCGRDLDKLPTDQRVYVIGPATPPPEPASATPPVEVPATPEPAEAAATPPPPASPEAGENSKPAKKSKAKRTKKKKS